MRRTVVLIGIVVAVLVPGAVEAAPTGSPPRSTPAPTTNLGGDYPLPDGVTVVVRDWFSGRAAPDPAYSICYVNAFQTQTDESGVRRPDETSEWPADLVLTGLGDDPNWPGEYLVDISTRASRRAAARHVEQMVATCARRGFAAVEFDNLDSWTRFDGTPREDDVPFGKAAAIGYATLLTRHAHSLGLAVGQKNTPQLGREVSREVIGFDFVIAEECGQYRECDAYRRAFGRRIIDVEYTDRGFARACAAIGEVASVVRRDLDLRTPASSRYRFDTC